MSANSLQSLHIEIIYAVFVYLCQEYNPSGKNLLEAKLGPGQPDWDSVDPASGLPRRFYQRGKGFSAKVQKLIRCFPNLLNFRIEIDQLSIFTPHGFYPFFFRLSSMVENAGSLNRVALELHPLSWKTANSLKKSSYGTRTCSPSRMVSALPVK